MACGAEQALPPNIKMKYGIRESAHVYTSDQVLKQDGYNQLVQKISSMKGKCKIYVVGGSHSAFSVLYLLLRGPYKIRVFEDFKRLNK